MADADLLDEIKRGFELKNDAELAGFLGVTRATIHNARFEGDRKLGPKARFKVLDRIAFLRTRSKAGQWTEAVTTMALVTKLLAANNDLARNRALQNVPADAEEYAEKDLIEVVKEGFGCDTDEELADILGVKRNTISAIRHGKTTLGLEPRLKILNQIEPFDIERFQQTLASTDDLIEAIRKWREHQQGNGS